MIDLTPNPDLSNTPAAVDRSLLKSPQLTSPHHSPRSISIHSDTNHVSDPEASSASKPASRVSLVQLAYFV